MTLDFTVLDALRTHHPAWRLLRSDHAPLVASFLHRVFMAPNVRVMAAADLTEALEDELYALRQQLGDAAFPKPARDYLNDWAAADKGWLRKFYLPGTDEAQFDLTPATEKAIAWLDQLSERQFRRYRIAALDPVRTAQADERGQRSGPQQSASPSCISGATRSTPRSNE